MDRDQIMQRLQDPKTLIIVAVAVVLLIVVRRLLARPNVSSHVTTTRCGSCGWTGQVSKFKPVCPRCAKPISI